MSKESKVILTRGFCLFRFRYALLSLLVLTSSLILFSSFENTLAQNITEQLSSAETSEQSFTSENQSVPPINSSPPQISKSDNFLTYENTTYGVKMMYPSGWDYYESGEYGGFLDIAVFQSPLEGRTDMSSATVAISTDTLANKDQTLKEYFDQLLPAVQESMSGFNYKILESKLDNGITLAGRPAYQTLSTNTQDNMNFITFEIGTLANGKAYIISYNAEDGEYQKYLPTVQQMINSLQIRDQLSSSLSSQSLEN
jgi:hypothetical protein